MVLLICFSDRLVTFKRSFEKSQSIIIFLIYRMFSNIISQKFDKYNKIDINKYLNNKKEPSTVVKKSEEARSTVPQSLAPVPSSISQHPSQQPHTHSKKNNQYDLRGFLITGLPPGSSVPGKLDKSESGIIIQIIKKTLNILYFEGDIKNRLQMNADSLNKSPEHNEAQGSINVSCKKITKYRIDGTRGTQWLLIEEVKDKDLTVTIVFKQKEFITKGSAVKKAVLDKLQEEDFLVKQTVRIAPGVVNAPEDPNDKDAEDDADVVKFVQPSPSQLAESDKFRKSIRDMKDEDKVTILTDIFKIKKEYQDPMMSEGRRRLKCPIFTCGKAYRELVQLRQHIKKHPELAKNGIQLTDYGVFEYSQKAIDLTLALGKMFPSEIKKIIKKMKTKPQNDA